MINRVFQSFTLLLIFTLSATAEVETSQSDAALEREVAVVAGSVLSPYCPGRLLRDCPSSAARELKEKVRELLRSGRSSDEVIEELLAMHGEDIRAAPLMSGFGLWAWILPVVFLLGGFAFVLAWLKSRQLDESTVETAATGSVDERYRKLIEDELAD